MSPADSPLLQVRHTISSACEQAQRDLASVQLIAVSKTWPAERITPLYEEGQLAFGENKLQELQDKAPALPTELDWHYIGGIQRNKIRKILQHANWIHSVDSQKLLDAIDRIAGEETKCPNLFLQINVDLEETKGGVAAAEAAALVQHAQTLPNINLVGLMCIPQFQEDPAAVRPAFARLRALRDEIAQTHNIDLPYLSMGMSHDYPVAIQEGATHIRVGSALFGARNYPA